MHTNPSKRRRARMILLAGILTFLFFGMAGVIILTFGNKEMTIMPIAQAAAAAEKGRPPIDLTAPAHTETATFALG